MVQFYSKLSLKIHLPLGGRSRASEETDVEPEIPLGLLIKQQEEKPIFFQTLNGTNIQRAEHHIIYHI